MKMRLRGVGGVLVSILALTAVWAVGSVAARAASKDVFVLSCPSATHVADFTACVTNWEFDHGQTGLGIATNPTAALTAFAQVTGSFRNVCAGKGSCTGGGSVRWVLTGAITLVKPDGSAITTDADLATADMQVFAQMRAKPPIKIPPNYGTSPINNPTVDVDTNTAINVQWPGNVGQVPMGTMVMVQWQDGSTAIFVRTSSVPTLLWVYVPGTARDSNGHPINISSGTMQQNPNNSGSGSGSVVPTTPPNFNLNIIGLPDCAWRAQWHNNGDPSLSDGIITVTVIGYAPCPN